MEWPWWVDSWEGLMSHCSNIATMQKTKILFKWYAFLAFSITQGSIHYSKSVASEGKRRIALVITCLCIYVWESECLCALMHVMFIFVYFYEEYPIAYR